MAEFSDWIGRSVTRIDTLTQRLADKYRATMAPFLFDEDEHTAPPGLHFGLAPATPEPDQTGPDGAELKGVFLPPIRQPQRMWAGGSIMTIGTASSVSRAQASSSAASAAGPSGV